MQTSLFLARLIGPVMLVVGLAVFANLRRFRDIAEEFLASRALMFLSGLAIMPVGVAIVLKHNIWTADWRVLITIVGWLNVVSGVLRLFGPLFVVRAGHAILKQPYFTSVAAAIWVVFGLLFCFFGYLR
ncbi:hypothetical protein [Bradyrhizobium sp.]|jgi:hypothetical protein|uniref:hypothetical protein n=1 Tax=Bradyrhizobium sp. TaxID=376 RepID=UPI003C78DA88